MCGATLNSLFEMAGFGCIVFLAFTLFGFGRAIGKQNHNVNAHLTKDSDSMYGLFLFGMLRFVYWSAYTNSIHT